MTPEKKVKNALVKELKRIGAYYFFPASHGYGRSGIPDICGCYHGWFFGFECKAGNNKATALQLREINAIQKADGLAMVVNEDSVQDAIAVLMILKDRK